MKIIKQECIEASIISKNYKQMKKKSVFQTKLYGIKQTTKLYCLINFKWSLFKQNSDVRFSIQMLKIEKL